MGTYLCALASSPPNSTNFDTSFGSTNFSDAADMGAVAGMTLATTNAKIMWNNAVNASSQDFDTNIIFGEGFVSVNSSALNLDINSSANITINDVQCPAVPYYADGFYSTFSEIKSNSAECDFCTNIVCSGTTLTFTTSHFTGFIEQSACGTLNESDTTYVLQNDVSAEGTCFNITADNVTIDGAGFTITGNINASVSGAAAFTGLIINNTIVDGSISSIGADYTDADGYSGGSVELITSTATTITTTGGYSENNNGGAGGAVTINTGSVITGAITTTGGETGALAGAGGAGGAVTITNSNATAITTTGGETGGASAGPAGTGGAVTITNSTATTIIASGGTGDYDGGAGGAVNITSSNVTSITTTGGGGSGAGGPGGNVTFDPCPTPKPTVDVSGGTGTNANGANGTITPSDCYAGYVAPLACGDNVSSSLTLLANLTCEGTALIIGADNVVINGAGFTITGNINASGAGTNAWTGLIINNTIVVGGCFFSRWE